MVSCVARLQILLEEVSILKSKFEPNAKTQNYGDTGHLRTTVSVLDNRIEEIKKNIKSKLKEK